MKVYEDESVKGGKDILQSVEWKGKNAYDKDLEKSIWPVDLEKFHVGWPFLVERGKWVWYNLTSCYIKLR